MRIVGGRFGGTQLASIGDGDPDGRLRPTSDRMREALFNILMHGDFGDSDPLQGARVLDLFAGTGALGLEALSRGAAQVVFVDDGAKARATIRANAERLGATGLVKIWRRDATRLGPNRGAPFDLVFLDPPYGRALGEAALEAAHQGGWIASRAVIVWEEGGEVLPPPWAVKLDTRRYGSGRFTILRREG